MMIGLMLAKLIDLLSLLVFVRCLLSWVRVDPYNPLVRLVYQLTDPLMRPFQAFTLRSGNVGVDFSPVIVLLLLQVVRNLVLRLF